MKTVYLFIVAIALSFNAYAQKSLSDAKSVNYYGVDFTEVKVYNATEDPADFVRAFNQINTLILNEPKKYDMSAFGKPIDIIDIDPVMDLNEEIDEGDLVVRRKSDVGLNEAQLEAIVQSYKLREREGIGLVLIAELLDKPDATGVFHVVFFDIASREIVKTSRFRGSAKGFGLRNFWAGSIYSIIKKVKW